MNWTAGVEYTYIFFGLCFWSALCFVGGSLKIRRRVMFVVVHMCLLWRLCSSSSA
jgi:hypothetical protein